MESCKRKVGYFRKKINISKFHLKIVLIFFRIVEISRLVEYNQSTFFRPRICCVDAFGFCNFEYLEGTHFTSYLGNKIYWK